MEILIRQYKPVANRLRPQDRMVAHTGYLIFARKVGLGAGYRPDAEPVSDEAGARPGRPVPKSRRPDTVEMGSFWGKQPGSENAAD
jgi:tRNA (adenine57-N1/adenine58-N1)-methyltransferase